MNKYIKQFKWYILEMRVQITLWNVTWDYIVKVYSSMQSMPIVSGIPNIATIYIDTSYIGTLYLNPG